MQVLGAASSAVDFLAVHPYPVYGWDYLDYVNGRSSNLQALSPAMTAAVLMICSVAAGECWF